MDTSSAFHRSAQRHGPLIYRRLLTAAAVIMLGLACLPALPVQAGTTLVLTEEQTGDISLAGAIDILEPGIPTAGINEIHRLPDDRWRNSDALPASVAFHYRQSYWYRIRIDNRAAVAQQLVLGNSSYTTDSLSVYIQQGDRLHESALLPSSIEGSFAAALEISPATAVTLYIKSSGFHSAYIPLTLQTDMHFRKLEYNGKFYNGIINGAIMGLTLYNLLLGIKTRQPMYHAYCVLGFFCMLAVISHQNIFAIYFPSSPTTWRTNAAILAPLLIAAGLTQFFRIFMDTARNNPRRDKLLVGNIVLIPTMMLAFLLEAPMRITSPVYLVISSLSFLTMLQLCVDSKQHLPITRLLTAAGISMPILSGLLMIFAASGYNRELKTLLLAMQSTDVATMAFLSIAMASRLRQQQHAHEIQVQLATEARITSDANNRLLAHLNHELRTPLNGILGAAEILLHKSNPSERYIFNMIYQTALPLKHLVDDIVNIDSISDRKKPVQSIRFDLKHLLQECMDIFLPLAHKKSIRLFFSSDPDMAYDVTGDPNRLRQILLNLIGNACKFTDHGAVGVHVSDTMKTADTEPLYLFTVTDSGVGISQDDEQHLFQSFVTGHSPANRQGAGLGLAIVRELTETLGGSCGYRENIASGSQFWFTVKLERHPVSRENSRHAFAGLSVIIADESPLICEQLARHISHTDNCTIVAHSSAEMLQNLQAGHTDLVIAHQPIVDAVLQQQLSTSDTTIISYIDDSEPGQPLSSDHNPTLLRNTCIEDFCLQLASRLANSNALRARGSPEDFPWKLLRVLVAEDIPTNQHVLREILAALSIEPVICDNGKQACDAYLENLEAGHPFDIIIMDCEMPVMDGFEATRYIRRHEAGHQLPPIRIVALTAHTEPGYRERSLAAGMNAYLTKPVSINSIRDCLSGNGIAS